MLQARLTIVVRALIIALVAQISLARPAADPNRPDACALLADADVRAVLGVPVTERHHGSHEASGLLLSQCYLGTGTPRSVSIAVAGNTKSGARTITPRAFWREQFHRGEGRESERAREHGAAAGNDDEREREHEAEARPIAGVGEEAFWSGSRVAGALYVLRGNAFIRVSVGGIGDETERIEKSRQLALSALAKFR